MHSLLPRCLDIAAYSTVSFDRCDRQKSLDARTHEMTHLWRNLSILSSCVNQRHQVRIPPRELLLLPKLPLLSFNIRMFKNFYPDSSTSIHTYIVFRQTAISGGTPSEVLLGLSSITRGKSNTNTSALPVTSLYRISVCHANRKGKWRRMMLC